MSTVTAAPFTSVEAADLAGVSYRRLDFWVRQGAVRSSFGNARGSGSRRSFSARDVNVLVVCKYLMRGEGGRGVLSLPTEHLADITAELYGMDVWPAEWIAFTDGPMRVVVDLSECVVVPE